VDGRGAAPVVRSLPFRRAGEGDARTCGNLSRDCAGMMVRFKTDAKTIWAHYILAKEKLASPNMTAIGGSGIDLYARDAGGKWKWVGVTKPDKKEVRQAIVADLAPGLREYAAYLPLYNGIESLDIGVPPDAKFEELAPRAEKPIASTAPRSRTAPRPRDRAWCIRRSSGGSSIVGGQSRLLWQWENGRGSRRVHGEDRRRGLCDRLPAEHESRRSAPESHSAREALKAAHPATADRSRGRSPQCHSWILPARNQHHTDNHAALRESFDALKNDGVTGLFYIPGDALIGDDGESSTDGSHPSDLGFVRQAANFRAGAARGAQA